MMPAQKEDYELNVLIVFERLPAQVGYQKNLYDFLILFSAPVIKKFMTNDTTPVIRTNH